jgi:hypothetical protein
MNETTDTRDRVIRLETKLEAMASRQEVTDTRVEKMYEILTKADGAKWILTAGLSVLSMVAGGIAYAKQWIPFLPLPK